MKVYTLLLAGFDYVAKKPVSIALSMNSDFASTDAVGIAEWVRNELILNDFDPNNVRILIGDNANDVADVANELGVVHIGCLGHLFNLVVEDAWSVMALTWLIRVKNIITLSKTSYHFANKLKAVQGAGKALQLLTWNELRWQGKYTSLARFYEIMSKPEARALISTTLSDDNMSVMILLLPLLRMLAIITCLLTGEKILEVKVKSASAVHYGSHLYPVMWHTLSFIFRLSAAAWDSIANSVDYVGTWNFVVRTLDGIYERFFKQIPVRMRAAFALSAETVLSNDPSSYFEHYSCFFRVQRVVSVPLPDTSPSRHLTCSEYYRILRYPFVQWLPNSPVNQETQQSHLKFMACKFQLAWRDLLDQASQISALNECYSSTPTQIPAQLADTQTSLPHGTSVDPIHDDSMPPKKYASLRLRRPSNSNSKPLQLCLVPILTVLLPGQRLMMR